ncbi:thioredoxin family protein [Mesobacillus foraminis]|uniref:Thioredoxin n=1 Tax=Mesobacillus foraminis TaxID=279826 RepID=A0A4R2BLI6_9BACI|nr:thioredoxin family protein [Mesobacillus foraminis]MBT2758308.1 thioredoxin family protein [Mesobacillus foraminis]TCN26894.1 thioredoxin [Mesobacillus foraminis]
MIDWPREKMEKFFNESGTGLVYFYTPLCGTCQMAGKMLNVVEQLHPDLSMGKVNLNFLPETADEFKVESVPCLLLVKDGTVKDKLYAFHSVPYLHETIKQTLQ